MYPTTVVDSLGKTQVADRFLLEVSALVPNGMPDTDLAEAVAQSCNLTAATLIKDSIKSGFAPT
jgi:hypothetical protein